MKALYKDTMSDGIIDLFVKNLKTEKDKKYEKMLK